MRFWFVHSGEVSLREQICTQVYLGIASGALGPERPLPSTRTMARRYGLHPNTVSAAYRQMQAEGLLEMRKGAGMFVRASQAPAPAAGNRQLDRMIAGFLSTARAQGFSLEDVIARVRRWMDVRPPDHFLVVEPEDARREIVLAELRAALTLNVRGCATEDCGEAAGCIAVALPSKAAAARDALPPHTELMTLRVTDVPSEMRTWLDVEDNDGLIGIVSGWPEFVRMARTMLVATGFAADRFVARVRGEPGWKDVLAHTAVVVCDAATAPLLPRNVRPVVFPLVSAASLGELRAAEDAITRRLNGEER